ncbi:oxygen-insensitive NADPH nitroreductase [Nitrincola tibetensis]|uniref:Oxygen-insensitive NADPH nitroreductase n=1 Tax=Nitrincola tibetensis TaxID=2219697 RepID=A0A364NNT7_9GAMM|nr:oxygen-insensitive NADPH nitroreductase [Nitrincola tibetensis]RAU18682.1 oxygen-insensitive NADPH nitroreductase [Nitrincola tibetensis]
MNDVINLLNQHRSIRKFTEQSVPNEWIGEIVKAGQAAATSSFIQACTVIQVSQGDTRDQLAQCSGNQIYVAQAPVFLVFCADMHRHKDACELHQQPMLSGYTEQFLTASLDCGLFAQNCAVAAESLGLGVVYIGGLRNQIARVSELLELPELVYPVFGMCLGFPDQNPEVKPRLPLEIVLKQEKYSVDADVKLMPEYDAQVQEYYRTRTGGGKEMTWTEQISGMLVKESRPHMLPFLNEKGFLLK